MKKVKIFWTPFAVKVLDEIHEYIQEQTHSIKIADKFIARLTDRVEQLKDFPESWQIEEFLKHLSQNSRYLVEGNYKIIYQYQENKVIVTDVFHVKQNPIKLPKRTKK